MESTQVWAFGQNRGLEELERQGFLRLEVPGFPVTSDPRMNPVVHTYWRVLEAGEKVSFPNWVILVAD